MAKEWSVRVEGLKELDKKLRKVPDLAQAAIPEALLKAARPMREQASQMAPVGPTGELHQNIIIEGPMTDVTIEGGVLLPGDAVKVKIGPDSDHWYGIFAELGTSHHSAQPFLRPTFDEHRMSAVKAVGSELWATVRRAGL